MLVSKAAIEAGRSVAVYSVPRLLAEIKATYDRDGDGSYLQLFDRLCGVDLLHLDDLGAERTTDWVLEQLYSIVNERWQDERSILITTNLTEKDKLHEQLTPRTVSRLIEMCGDPIPIMGPDLRELADAP
jgi:DNA replication protein DnaC